jgi:glycosyltransferase involved in cell wall biosynthesis
MRIAVNTRFLLKGKLEGIGWFTHQTIKRMVLEHPEHEFIFLFDRPFNEEYIFANNVTPVVIAPPARHPILWWIWFEVSVPRALKKYNADVFISTDGFASLRCPVPQCIVMHDLAYFHYPEHLAKHITTYLKYFTKKWINASQHIFTVSKYTQQDIIKTYNVAPEKVSAVHNGANQLYQPIGYTEKQVVKEQYSDGTEYFIYAGSLHPRKNIVRLLKAFAIFKRNTTSNMKLILVGRLAWNTKEIEFALNNHPYKKDIIRHEYMEAEQLCKLIAAAYAMVYVSLFEGFGIPILESLCCNIPAITSNTSSMPEVGGDACLYVNPMDEIAIADALMLLYNDEVLRNQLISKAAAQAALFNWDTSMRAMHDIVKKIANK